MKKGKYNYS